MESFLVIAITTSTPTISNHSLLLAVKLIKNFNKKNQSINGLEKITVCYQEA
jgi:hypothetical protein